MFAPLITKALKKHAAAVHVSAPPKGAHSALLEGDCLELFTLLPPGSVDLIFADPPYLLSNGGTTNSGGRRVDVDKGAWDRGAGGVDHWHGFNRRWLNLARRSLRPSGTIWVSCHYESAWSIGFAMQSLGFHLLNLITWEKPNPPPNLGCRCLTHSAEMVIWAAPALHEPLLHTFNYEELKRANGDKQLKDVWTFPAPAPMEKRFGKHPTQKPEALLERIVAASTKPGDLVLDPFCGSGTTGVVAARHGLDFVGLELDPVYVDLAARRITAELVGPASDYHHERG